MKPIVITIQDNKIMMSIDEFKKHINDAYDQGFRDASSITSSQSNRWWNELYVGNSSINDAKIATLDTKSNCIDEIVAHHANKEAY